MRGVRTRWITAINVAGLGVYMYQALKDGHTRENNAVVFHRLIRWRIPFTELRLKISLDLLLSMDVFLIYTTMNASRWNGLSFAIET